MESKLKKLDESLKAEADTYNQIQKGAHHLRLLPCHAGMPS